jgi:hypothetical protein
MSSEFQPRHLPYDPSLRTCFVSIFYLLYVESKYSNIPPAPLLDHLGRVSMVFGLTGVETPIDFSALRQVTCIQGKFILVVCLSILNPNNEQSFLSSLHGFEDTLFHFVGDSRMKDILRLLGVIVVKTTVPEPGCLIRASHQPTLSPYEYQKLCSVLCAYRFFEIISLRAQCISRIPISTPTAYMFLPGPPSPQSDLFVSVLFMLQVISHHFSGIFPFARLAKASDGLSGLSPNSTRSPFANL